MRAREFLSEVKYPLLEAVTRGSTPTSVPRYLDSINKILAQDGVALPITIDSGPYAGYYDNFIPDSGQQIPMNDFSWNYPITGTVKGKPFLKINAKGKESPVLSGDIFKSDEIKGVGYKSYNLGNVTEGIFATAIYIRLAAGAPITSSQVVKGLKALGPWRREGSKKTTSTQYADPKDGLNLFVRLSQNNYTPLQDDLELQGLADHITSIVNYVNAEEIVALQNDFALNEKVDKITVIADGMADEKENKVDVEVVYVNPDGQNVVTYERSVKTGSVDQFGQVSTGGRKIDSGMKKGMKANQVVDWRWKKHWEYWNTWGIDVSAAETTFKRRWHRGFKDPNYDWINAFTAPYQEAEKQFKSILYGDDNERKAIQHFFQMIQFHARKDKENARTTNFDKGAYEELDFRQLDDHIKSANLTAEYALTKRGGKERKRPEIHIINANTDEVFLKFRLYVSQGKISNLIEKGPLVRKWAHVASAGTDAVRTVGPQD